jgi:replicative DNA helicase
MSDDVKKDIMREVSEEVDNQVEADEEGSPDRSIMYNEDGSPKKPDVFFREQFRAAKYLLDVMKAHEDGANANTECYPTDFSNLDALLDGGLYPGLYVVGAVSSLGKTSFMLQMADQIAAQGTDVIYVSLEMAPSELVSKSISRMTYQLCEGKTYAAKTARGITSAARYAKYSKEEKDLIGSAIVEYSRTIAGNMYFLQGVGDVGVQKVKKFVADHEKYIGKKAVVMIDYLQILAPHDPKYSDKMNTDKSVLELKRMSRDFNIPVVAISSFNRDSYSSEVSMSAFKESGAIEYGSDVLIALQPQGMLRGYRKDTIAKNADIMIECKKAKHLRKVEAVILKNRNGATETKAGFEYRPMFNLFDPDRKYKQDNDSFESGQDDDEGWTQISSTDDQDEDFDDRPW